MTEYPAPGDKPYDVIELDGIRRSMRFNDEGGVTRRLMATIDHYHKVWGIEPVAGLAEMEIDQRPGKP